MSQIEAEGNKIIAACESLQNKEWEMYMSECEELNMLMTTQQNTVLQIGKDITRKDTEELKHCQTINNQLSEEINKKMSELSVLESKLPGILSRCGEEQHRQAKEMMDR